MTTSVWQHDRVRLASWRARGVSSLVTPPADEPVSLPTFKRHAKITDDSLDEDVLPLRIAAARAWVENYTGRCCFPQTWRDTFDQLPSYAAPLLLGRRPLMTISPATSPIVSVTRYDTLDAATVLDAASYRVDDSGSWPRLIVDDGVSWNDDPRSLGSVVVEYTVGYGYDPELVPAGMRQAILLLAAEWHAQAEAATDAPREQVPFGIVALLDQYL